MPAKLTVIVYILICLEVGVLLVILPWTSYWDDNIFLYFLTGKMHAAWLGDLLQSGYVRGLVTSLGLVNIGAGIWEAYRFRESVRAFSAWESPANESVSKEKDPSETRAETRADTRAVTPSAPLPDHGPHASASDSAKPSE